MAANDTWTQIKLRTDKNLSDTAADLLEQLGALSVTFEDAEDSPILEPRPGERRLWPHVVVTGLFAQGTDPEPILSALRAILGDHIPMAAVSLEDKNWIRAWMDQFKPIKCGRRLWICPSWLHVGEPGSVVVMLDPGLAFGTGTHPTTWLCLNFLDSLDLTDKKVVDYGCGSGILGIAALKLGAAKASGVDIDEQAIIASEENAERNGLKGKFTLYLGEASAQLEPADVTVANILAGPLAELEPEIARLTAKGGRLALSGVLKDQAQEVCKAYERDFEIGNVSSRGDWALITAVRR
ncbi:MAG: 50S ribosomal protein L11 methyltransferase [Succinivibrio sp.]|jgi:ribosomal protein L11 methyltransferase|nr:50S ribosomal protein L11 methyltransferase [Succinivibrio sp.]